MDVLLTKLKRWNDEMKDTPRKLLMIFSVLLCALLAGLLLPLIWPFALAAVFSLLMAPLVRLIVRWLHKWKGARIAATLTGMVVVFGIIGVVGWFTMDRVFAELLSLARSAPDTVSRVYGAISGLVNTYSDQLSDQMRTLLTTAISEGSKTLLSAAAQLSSMLATWAIGAATSLPSVLLSVVLTVMGTFYLSYDKERILSFFKRILPRRVTDDAARLKTGVFTAVFGQFKSQLLVSLLITLTVIAGLLLQGKPYWLLIGLLIGVADALPVVGAGLFLIPWSILGFLVGDMPTGAGMALLYVATIVVRQISEPRIVGKNLGLYPLATMMSMYAGFRLIGFWGMLIGPVLLNICKVVLDVDRERHPA